MSDEEESLENLTDMLRQMQLNRMRLEAMQTTHAVLLQTRDGLVRVRPSLSLVCMAAWLHAPGHTTGGALWRTRASARASRFSQPHPLQPPPRCSRRRESVAAPKF